MAGNTIETNLRLNATGIKEATEDAKRLNSELSQAIKNAGKARTAGQTSAVLNANNKDSRANEGMAYSIAQAGGGSGAAARDFGKQARGLGGLVHLYATFAANLFAVSTAFTALQRAMDTSNMIKGLDQLGAASGRNLGTLARQVQAASDGAISLRDSMEAVAKASAAGMSTTQITRMTEAAKKASQALGVNMADAISRITRGITKLEPELLDELGILVRVDKATQDYAKTVGKSVGSLTQFEKQQAFANAVLTEAEQKFGSIQIDSNPYSKLLASFQDLSFQGLELVNKVLGPMVNYLAQSPVALTAAVTAVGAALLKQAIPAIGAFRENANAAAEEARKLAVYRNKAAEAAHQAELKAVAQRAEELADRELMAKEAAIAKLEKQKGARKVGKTYAPILEKSADEVTDAELAKLRKEAAIQQKRGNVEAAKGYNDLAAAIETSRTAELNYIQAVDKNKKALADRNSYFSISGQLARQAEAANQSAIQKTIKTLASETVYTEGVRAAWKKLNTEIAAARSGPRMVDFGDGPEQVKKMTAMQAGWTRISGAVGIATAAVSAFAGAIGTAFMVVGAFVAVFEILDSVFGKNSKELEIFTRNTDALNESAANLDRTLDAIYKKKPGEGFSVDSINAMATAMQDLYENADKLADSFAKVNSKASGWDKFVDTMWDLVGRGSVDKLRDSISKTITSAIKSAPVGEARDEFKRTIAAIYNVDPEDTKAIQKVFDNIGSSEDASKLANSTSAALKQLALELNNTASVAKTADEGFKKINESYRNLANSLRDQSPLTLLGQNLVTESINIAKALNDPKLAITELVNLVKDESKLRLLPVDTVKQLKSAQFQIEQLAVSTEEFQKQLKDAEEARAKIASINPLKQSGRGLQRNPEYDALKEIIAKGDKAKIQLDINTSKLTELRQTLSGAMDESFKQGVRIITDKFVEASTKAQLAVLSSITARFSGPGKSDLETSIKNKELAIQERNIDTMFSLATSLDNLAILMEKEQLTKELASTTSESRISAISSRLGELVEMSGFTAKRFKATAADFDQLSANAKKGLSNYITTLFGAKAQLAGIAGERTKNTLAGQAGTRAENFGEDQKRKQLEIDINALTVERLRNLNSISGNQSLYLLSLKQSAEIEAESLANSKARAEAEFKINQLVIEKDNLAKQGADAQQLANAQKSVDAAQRELDTITKTQAIRADNSAVVRRQETIAAIAALEEKELAFAREQFSLDSERAQISLDIEQQRLGMSSQYGLMLGSQQIAEQAKLDILNAELQANQQITAALNEQASVKLKNATDRDKEMAGATTLDQIIEIAQRYDALDSKIEQSTTKRIDNTKLMLEGRKDYIKSMSEEQKLMAGISEATENLVTVFGDLGDAIGGSLKSLLTFQAGSKKLADAQADKLKKFAKGSDEYNEQEKENIQERTDYELKSAQGIAGATKKMFNEKTVAYKAFAAVEKAIAITRLVMGAKQMAQDAAETASAIAKSVARASTDGVAAVVKTLASLPFPANVAAGAAVAAIVAGLLSSIGGSGPNMSSVGMTAEDRQSTQGTGTSWQNGQKVENGGGVFGDSSAKSESIAHSLDIISSTSVEGLQNDNRMIDALLGIRDAVSGTAKVLYSVAGLRTKSIFNTEEGTKTSGISGLFGKTTTKEIIDAGIRLKGSFNDLAKGVSGAIQQYETVKQTKTNSGFLGIGKSTSTSISETYTAADKAISDSITKIFTNATNTFVQVGSKLGMSMEDVLSKLGNVNIDQLASLRGLSGEALQKEFESVISNILDTASSTLFESLSKYQQFGEGMLETVIRVTDANDKIKLSLTSIGKKYTELSFDVTEALSKASGGLDKFMEQVASFKDNFLTDAEKLKPIAEDVSNTLAKLGLSNIQTREQFKNLVNSIDLTTDAGQKMFIALMNIQDAFAQVTARHQELLDEYVSLEEKLADTLGGNNALKEALNKKELASMNDIERAQYLKNRQMEAEIDTVKQYNDLTSQLNQYTKTSVELRTEERNKLSDINKALYDVVNAYKDLKDANAAIATAMSTLESVTNSFASGLASAAAAVEAADQAIARNNASIVGAVTTAQKGIVDKYRSASTTLQNAKKATTAALAGITTGYLNAQKAVASASSAVASANKKAKDELRSLADNIMTFLDDLRTGALGILSGGDKFDVLKNKFAATAAAAQAGDKTAAAALPDLAQKVLELAQSNSSTSLEYAKVYGEVTSTLNDVSNKIYDAVGPSTPDVDLEQSQALADLAAAQAELAKWQDAVNVSGASSTEATIDLLKEWKDAKASEVEASEMFDKWTKLAEQAGLTMKDLIEDPMQDYIDARKAYLDSIDALNKWNDALAKSGISVKPEDTAIDTYLKAIEDRNQKVKDLEAWQKAIKDNGIDVSKATTGVQSTIDKYVADWKKANADLAEAQAKAAAAQAIISDMTASKLDAIKSAVEASANAIAKSILDSLNKPKEVIPPPNPAANPTSPSTGGPTTKIPETPSIPKSAAYVMSSDDMMSLNSAILMDQYKGDGGYSSRLLLSRWGVDSLTKLEDFKKTNATLLGSLLNPIPDMALPSFDVGTNYVPQDMIAQIHKGEAIIPARYNNQGNEDLVNEVRALRATVVQLLQTTNSVETNTRKSKDVLVRVTQDGEGMVTA